MACVQLLTYLLKLGAKEKQFSIDAFVHQLISLVRQLASQIKQF